MDAMDEIRRRKLEELKQQSSQQALEDQQMQQQIQQLEVVVKQALTKEALERYGNLKAAYPEKAVQVLVTLAQAIQTGQIQKIDDDTLKMLLKKITPSKRTFKIKRV